MITGLNIKKKITFDEESQPKIQHIGKRLA